MEIGYMSYGSRGKIRNRAFKIFLDQGFVFRD